MAGVCGMGLPSTGAIIHLLVLGEGDRSEPERRPPLPPPSPVLQCSLLSDTVMRPHFIPQRGKGADY